MPVAKPNPTRTTHRAGLHYLNGCLAEPSAVAVVTSRRVDLRRALFEAHAQVAEASGHRVARIDIPLEGVQGFLAALLAELGLDVYDASPDELLRLLEVYLNHQSSRSSRILILVDNVESLGPRVLDCLCHLLEFRVDGRPALSFVLGGGPGLRRVMDSPRMLPLRPRTRLRLDLDHDGAPEDVSPIAAGPHGLLAISRDGRIVGHRALEDQRLLIGRSVHNDLVIEGPWISRHHAVLVSGPESALICDLRSTNGTLVNGRVVDEASLRHGDIIGIGTVRLRYLNPQARREAPAVDSSGDATLLAAVPPGAGRVPARVR